MMLRPIVLIDFCRRLVVTLIVVASVALTHGCTSESVVETSRPQILVQGHPPRPHEMQSDGVRYVDRTGWYAAAQLDRFVRHYVRRNGIRFDFRGTDCQFWVDRDRDCLARGSYSSGYWRPVLDVKIGWDGHVTEHSLRIAADGNLFPPERVGGGGRP